MSEPTIKFSDYSNYLREIKTGRGIKKVLTGNVEDLLLQNEKTYYGGWMHPEYKIIAFVEYQSHHDFAYRMEEKIAKDYQVTPKQYDGYNLLFLQGWIKFKCDNNDGEDPSIIGGVNFLKKLSQSFYDEIFNYRIAAKKKPYTIRAQNLNHPQDYSATELYVSQYRLQLTLGAVAKELNSMSRLLGKKFEI